MNTSAPEIIVLSALCLATRIAVGLFSWTRTNTMSQDIPGDGN